MLGGCCVCLDERGWAENPLVYCDGQSCSVAVHQACYGIVKVPSGPWFCRKCESQERAAKVKCDLCPHRDGAFKKTDNGGWAHVVCALYIPEVAFGSVSTMEPISLAKVPSDRYNKACFLCEDENRSSKANTGACMSCAKLGCKASLHVTCAQMSGLLCEESTGVNQTKYCGYCKAHLPKTRKTTHKNIACSKIYQVRTTSSSEEVISTEEDEHHSAQRLPKPGDIRYTKAGKKRSKSLEDSLAAETYQKNDDNDTISNVDKKEAGGDDETAASQHESINSTESFEQDQEASADYETMDTDNAVTKLDDPTADVNSSKPCLINANANSPASTTLEGRPSEKSTTALNESPATDTQANDGAKDEMSLSREKSKPHLKRKKKSQKTGANSKKMKDIKKRNFKKDKKKAKDEQIPLSGFIPYPSILPTTTGEEPVSESGTALHPRHSVTTLKHLGLDHSEPCEPLDTGENNRIFKNDLMEDGVAALQKLMNDQAKDAFKFFRKHGSDTDVADLMDALKKIREENDNLENTIIEMTHRKEQLMLLKTKLAALQVQPTVSPDAGRTKQTQPPNASSTPVKSHPMLQPAPDMQKSSPPSSVIFTSPNRKPPTM